MFRVSGFRSHQDLPTKIELYMIDKFYETHFNNPNDETMWMRWTDNFRYMAMDDRWFMDNTDGLRR